MVTLKGGPTEVSDRPFEFVLPEGLTLLAVDDDPIQLEFCSVYLGAPGVELVLAGSAEAALEILAGRLFSAAMFDVDMPGMSGIDLVRRLRADRRYDPMPIMVITGREDMASIDDAFEAGATSFMCKPVNWRLLAHQIRFMVRAHRALHRADGPA